MNKEKKTINCSKCKMEVKKLKYLKKLQSGYFCCSCATQKRKEHREYLKREVLGIRKRTDLEEEWAEKRKNKIIKPKIKGVKEHKVRVGALGIYLTRQEGQILYQKYISIGLSPTQSSLKVRIVSQRMRDLVRKMREDKQTKQEISKKFKEEFAQLVSQ